MRLRQQDACARSVEAEQVRAMIVTSYRDYLKPHTCAATGDPVFPLKMLHERNGR